MFSLMDKLSDSIVGQRLLAAAGNGSEQGNGEGVESVGDIYN